MPIAILRYRCRRCAVITDGGMTNESNIVVFLIMITMGKKPPGIPATMYEIHHCADGNYGVSDLIGAEVRGV